MRLVVVDDDEFLRNGIGVTLDDPAIELHATMDHDEALAAGADFWSQVDTVLVDAADRCAVDDQFPGVAVVRRIRELLGPDPPPTITMVSNYSTNAALAQRAAEAGAQWNFPKELQLDRDGLSRVILRPESLKQHHIPPDTARLRELGITCTGQGINGLLDLVAANPEFRTVLRNGENVPHDRRWDRFLDQVKASLTITKRGRGGDTRVSAPNVTTLRRVYADATQTNPPGPMRRRFDPDLHVPRSADELDHWRPEWPDHPFTLCSAHLGSARATGTSTLASADLSQLGPGRMVRLRWRDTSNNPREAWALITTPQLPTQLHSSPDAAVAADGAITYCAKAQPRGLLVVAAWAAQRYHVQHR